MFNETVNQYKRALVIQALVGARMNASAAARQLGVHRNHIDYLCRELNIDTKQLKLNYRALQRMSEVRRDLLSDKPQTIIGTSSRIRLPETRKSVTRKFTIGNHRDLENPGVRGYVTVGLYEDGSPGEVFIHVDRVGSIAHGFAEAWAVNFSIALQYGVPLAVLIGKAKHVRFEPMGTTDAEDHDELKFASSIIDYIARWMEIRFLGRKEKIQLEPGNPEPENVVVPPKK